MLDFMSNLHWGAVAWLAIKLGLAYVVVRVYFDPVTPGKLILGGLTALGFWIGLQIAIIMGVTIADLAKDNKQLRAKAEASCPAEVKQ